MDMVERGTLAPVIDEVLPLERAVEGLRLIENREVFGKVIVAP
jgi:NADPH:quinone reductase-like Zn-dependent oxidoreductase